MLRSHHCGSLRLEDTTKKVTLCGWVQRIRDKGKVAWIDLRDRYGITQLLLEESQTAPKLFEQIRTLGREYVIRIHGEVVKRRMPNPKLPTGEIEVRLDELEVINKAKTPPFLIEDETDGLEELRMQYRYLDLRRPCMQKNLLFRQELMAKTRAYLTKNDFLEVETPLLIRSTPEGARDFVVPSRKESGHFYALPQSPQILKQLLMVAGMDRYFQFARCFRDEDLRADRQPEFTQLDCELSFMTQEEVISIFEGLVKTLFVEMKGVHLPDFRVMTYEEAMRLYGSDKPDLRFGMTFLDFTEEASMVACPLWPSPERVGGFVVKGGSRLSRKMLDKMQALVQEGTWAVDKMTYIKYGEEGIRSPLSKWYTEDILKGWGTTAGAETHDALLLIGGDKHATQEALGALRLAVIKTMEIKPSIDFAPLWVVDFPLLTWDDQTQRYHAMHHPFTAPKREDLPLLETDPSKVHSHAYDLVINGAEIGGGSLRIHDPHVQERVFAAIGIDHEKAWQQFGPLLSALQYGTPPHGGIALGWDRLCLVMQGGRSIRDYIPFPKNNAARDVMLGAPSLIPSS
ncbi:MAG: aspartate--tRNA ligase [Bacteroidota bacterium]